ncbi:MAG: DUF6090 family protein [Woeseiaceae bacterium]|nr:DUF6090 family protein [Woeseiaceae bacterium]
MLRTFVANLRKQHWGQALLELLMVVIGILLAFQVDRWWEERKDLALQQEYIERLIGDIEQDVEQLQNGIMLAETRRSFAKLLMDVAEDPAIAVDSPVEFTLAVNQAAYTYTPALSSNTFDELRSTGNLGLLRAPDITNALFDYYRYDESQRQYLSLKLMQEFRHFVLAAGVLTNRQARRAEDDWGIVSASELEAFREAPVNLDDVRASAERLSANAELVAWLPIAYGMQREQATEQHARLDRARSLLDILRSAVRTAS